MKYVLIIAFSVIFIFSCGHKKNATKEVVIDWIGKEISLIDTLPVLNQADSSLKPLNKMRLKKLKWVIYIDATCFTCARDLTTWAEIAKEFNPQKVDFLFYIHPDDLNVLKPYLQRWRFNLPFIIDMQNTFFYSNNISNEKLFQAMLLDENNKVVIIGNPVYSKNIISLYKKMIN